MTLSIAAGNQPAIALAQSPTVGVGQSPSPRLVDFPAGVPLKWSWACRSLPVHGGYRICRDDAAPQPGDIVLTQIASPGYHERIMTSDHERLRLYEGDCLVGVLGNRYATDAYEAVVDGVGELHILTGAGMIGTVVSRNQRIKPPTRLSFLGYVAGEDNARINLKRRSRPLPPVDRRLNNVVLMIGTGMNSGKTTTAAKLTKSLLRQGRRVAACKVTGSVSHRDLHELRSTGVHDVRDFSDYGFPSTYLCEEAELIELFEALLTDAARVDPEVVVMEIADGVLQRETQLLLNHAAVRSRVCGVVLAAGCAPSALFGVEQVRRLGLPLLGVSGCITNSPLFMQEFAAQCDVPLGSSADCGRQLSELVIQRCRLAS